MTQNTASLICDSCGSKRVNALPAEIQTHNHGISRPVHYPLHHSVAGINVANMAIQTHMNDYGNKDSKGKLPSTAK